MKQIVVPFKNQIVVASIVVGAIILAIPICIFGLIRLAWAVGNSLVLARPPVSKKLRRVAETIEARISGQIDEQTK